MATGNATPILAKLQQVQTDFELAVDSHQQLLSQLSENQQVQKEFSNLAPDARIYKRTGPVLLPQDSVEAKSNVEKRIEYIRTELQRVEKRLEELGSKRDAIQNELVTSRQQ
ncbi:Prefoldin subunit 6 [Malassezia pachydermatis]|uniref:Prefoldin subunit 6 n=1 Tax=Malassezia pachydermatis TaxID=77020 RepID=A0A0M8MT07_9BASI|nr:prefoldin subunit 6 [Malassezia pachydermatis]KOS13031.1 prefoldin subunit 6 [Malassezia pachydermatis]